MINRIHKWLDDRPNIETNVYERRAVWIRETILLAATLITSVIWTDPRSFIPAILVAVATAIQSEDKRAKASVIGRHAGAPELPPHKQAILDRIAWREQVFLWAWPSVATGLSAAYARNLTWALVVALVAGYVRAAWDFVWFPTWRKSRLEWSQRRK